MTFILLSWRDGWRRVAAAPSLLAGVFVVTLLGAIPLALTMREAIEAHLGSSLMAHQAADGVNWDWWQEFTSQAASGGGDALSTTFTPSVIGFAATLDGISSVLDAQSEIAPVTAAVAAYLLAWLFLSGGIIDRYARQRRTRAHGFFAASGVFFWRFLRLGIAAGLAYAFLLLWVHEWLFDDWLTPATRDLDVERTAFFWRAGMYAIFALLLAAVNVIVDYAKVRMVVEDRRSAIGALRASGAFIRRNPGRVVGLYAVNTVGFVVTIRLWGLLAPGAGSPIWLGFLAAQLYVLARLAVKLQFLASQTALFQLRLAHAAYTAAPPALWPESPAAEAVGVDRP